MMGRNPSTPLRPMVILAGLAERIAALAHLLAEKEHDNRQLRKRLAGTNGGRR